jgi:hypothetical protein
MKTIKTYLLNQNKPLLPNASSASNKSLHSTQNNSLSNALQELCAKKKKRSNVFITVC